MFPRSHCLFLEIRVFGCTGRLFAVSVLEDGRSLLLKLVEEEYALQLVHAVGRTRQAALGALPLRAVRRDAMLRLHDLLDFILACTRVGSDLLTGGLAMFSYHRPLAFLINLIVISGGVSLLFCLFVDCLRLLHHSQRGQRELLGDESHRLGC